MGLTLWSARRQRRAGKYARALGGFRDVLRSARRGSEASREAYAGAAFCCVALGRWPEAQKLYTEGFAEATQRMQREQSTQGGEGGGAQGLPELPTPEDYLALAKVLDRSAQAAKCVAAVDLALERGAAPNDKVVGSLVPGHLLMAARNARRLQRLALAAELLERACGLCDPSSGEVPGEAGRYTLGDLACELCSVHEETGDDEAMERVARQMLCGEDNAKGGRAPKVARNRQRAAWYTHRFERAPDAAQKLRAALEEDPASAEGWHQLGRVHNDCGEVAEAEKALLECTELDPSCSKAFMLLGSIYTSQGKTDDAMWAMRSATDVDPKATKAWLTMAKMLEAMGKKGAACRIYEQAGDNPIAAARLQEILTKAAQRMQAVFKGFKERKARRQATVHRVVRHYGMRAPLPASAFARASPGKDSAGAWAVDIDAGTLLVAPKHVVLASLRNSKPLF